VECFDRKTKIQIVNVVIGTMVTPIDVQSIYRKGVRMSRIWKTAERYKLWSWRMARLSGLFWIL